MGEKQFLPLKLNKQMETWTWNLSLIWW